VHSSLSNISKKGVLAFAASLLTLGMVITGCTSLLTSTSITSNIIPNTNTSTSPVRITDAPSDQVLAASLTLNSMVLTDNTGKVTTNLVPSSGLTFEATHLDAVQEPLFSPAIPKDTYVSVTLIYSNAQVAYYDPATHTVDVVTATLANTTQTITFAAPVTIDDNTTSLLLDFLVGRAGVITISGSTVTVSPQFAVAAVPIPNSPTNGTNGLLTGHKGKVTAISASTNSFTMTDPAGTAMTIYVNAATVYQGISNFAALQVNALVEVDTVTVNGNGVLPKGSLLALRVDVEDTGTTPKKLLIGPVTSRTPTATGTPATSFNMLIRQLVGNSSATAVETVNVSVTGATNFLMPPRFTALATALPFAPSFTSSTIFAGQHVAVLTTGVTSGAATATTVLLQPQTISGTVTNITILPTYHVYTVTLPSGSWLASITGQSTVLVYTNGSVVPLTTAPTVTGATIFRFNGYLFNDSGTLKMLACVQAGAPGSPFI